nr:immunoglobulin light chain junction region [Macaca mulatta]MOY00797.1 immunoglobulin light chain junction region [Macaca mulatta]
CMHTLEFPWTF